METQHDLYTVLNVTATSNKKITVNNVSLKLNCSEILGLMGNANSGGATLCRALAGRLRSSERASGQIREPDAFSLQYVDFKDEFPDYLSVYEILTYCNRIHSTEWAIADSVRRFNLMQLCHVRCPPLSARPGE